MGLVLEVNHVSKFFKRDRALKDISFQGESGQIIGFTGHNGCGKTVLFKCILGLYKVDKGTIKINNEEVGIGEDMPRCTAFSIENPAFNERYSGRKNLSYLYELNHKKDLLYINRIMEKVGLNPSVKKPVSKYSLGMKQRLAIAQVLMENQDLLIFDEPMNGLDRKGVEDIRKLILDEKKKGKLILLASHNADDIKILCDHVYTMENGYFIN
jgi:ABC-2 type transport system ATP-binding protein